MAFVIAVGIFLKVPVILPTEFSDIYKVLTCHFQVSWTAALRSIVRNCYRHHGREDLLPEFNEDPNNLQQQQQQQVPAAFAHHHMVQTITNPDGTVSIIHIDTGPGGDTPQVVTLADGTQAQVVHAVSSMHGNKV